MRSSTNITNLIGVASCLLLLALPLSCQTSNRSQNNDGSANPNRQTQNPQSSTPALATTTKCEYGGPSPSCMEYTGLPFEGFSVAQSACTEAKGTFTPNAACSRVSNVGGCTQGGTSKWPLGLLVIYRYSPSYDATKVQQACQLEGEQYVQP